MMLAHTALETRAAERAPARSTRAWCAAIIQGCGEAPPPTPSPGAGATGR